MYPQGSVLEHGYFCILHALNDASKERSALLFSSHHDAASLGDAAAKDLIAA